MNILFLFMDGIGLGSEDPSINPLAAASMPNLEALLGNQKLTSQTATFIGDRATLVGLDANLGVPGNPQSASGQATLVTGLNVPEKIDGHFGPKPNLPIREILSETNVFMSFQEAGKQSVLLNAYPPGYFHAIESGRRMYSAIPMAVTNAGLALKDESDFFEGRAMAADFTGQGWRTHLGYADSPVLEPDEAGKMMAELTQEVDLAFLEYWISDYIGHGQEMGSALDMLSEFDQVLGGLVDNWDDDRGLILITSDHGNMEDLSTRKHTKNRVPALVIGAPELRAEFLQDMHDLTGVTPAIMRLAGLKQT